MEEWDSTWEFEMVNQAFGRAYNYFLNHSHLSAITTFTYSAANQTPADATAGASTAEKTLRTFQDAYKTAAAANPMRTWSVILASEQNRFQIEEALLQPIRDPQGNSLARVPVSTIVYYDGATIEMGTETNTYLGVTAGKCYAIFPKQRLLEFVHHDLRIDSDRPDISRLVEAQVIGRTRRGIYADIASSVEEITLPV
jgi:hypothetical protein